jgi:hypothetical protein
MACLSIFFSALAILGMAWRGDEMRDWPDAVAVPIIGVLLLVVVGAPFMAVAILLSKAKTGIVVSLLFTSAYVAANWMFANW